MTERKAEMMKEDDFLVETVVREMTDLDQEEIDHVPEIVTVNHVDVDQEVVNASVVVHVHVTVKQWQVTQKKLLKERLVKVKLVRRDGVGVQDPGKENVALVLGTGSIAEIVIVIAKRDLQVKRETSHSKSSRNLRMITLIIPASHITTISP